MEHHEIEENGFKYEFFIYKNMTEPCPVCGIPACGQEDILWYDNNGIRQGIIFDGGVLDGLIERFLSIHLEESSYESLPQFIREWNEGIGWAESLEIEGDIIDKTDFIKSISMMKEREVRKWENEYLEEYLSTIKELIYESDIQKSSIRISRG